MDASDSRQVRTRTLNHSPAEHKNSKHLRAANDAYGRGRRTDPRSVKDKKLRRLVTAQEDRYKAAIVRAQDAEILQENEPGFLEPEGELERTYRVRQDEIAAANALENVQKRFELKLEQLGPYLGEYSRNGRHLLLAGRKGHIATLDWREGKLQAELQLGEMIRDVKWLHNNQFFAVAQKKQVYIYDSKGVEIHALKQHRDVSHMEFLPYHWLLTTLNSAGVIKYLDTSTGAQVGEVATRLGTPCSFSQNPNNAILHVGHQNGTVTLWSPNSSDPLAKLLAHRGPVRSLAVDRSGRYMASTGADNQMAIWDIRMWKEVNSYFTRTPGTSISISDTGLVAVGEARKVIVWKGLFSQERVQSPYMTWGGEGRHIERVRFTPFEDTLGISFETGFASILVPGAGEANYDALEVNPFETKKQRQEGEVKALLNKLSPDMIALDSNFIGSLDLRSQQQRQAEKDLDTPKVDVAQEIRNKSRGKNSALKKYLRKQMKRNVIDEKRLKVEQIWKEEQEKKDRTQKEQQAELGPSLARFARKE